MPALTALQGTPRVAGPNTAAARERRVLVHAPVAREGTLVERMLAGAGIAYVISRTLADLADALVEEAGALLLTERSLEDPGLDHLTRILADQPSWSDLPVLLIVGGRGGRRQARPSKAARQIEQVDQIEHVDQVEQVEQAGRIEQGGQGEHFEPVERIGRIALSARAEQIASHALGRVRRLGHVHVTLLDRPLRAPIVISAVEAALRSRARQCQLRDALTAQQETREQAEATNRVKDEFLATLSHELRTPLNAILGWASMLRGGHVQAPMVARAHEIIERNARAQHALVADLLDVSRIITGKLALTPSPVAIAPLLATAIDTIASAAEAKRVTIRTHVDQDEATVVGDRMRLQQVFWNLLSNAVKFTPAGGCVEIDAHIDHDHVAIAVSDTGIGIEPAFLPEVFDRFRQADATTTRQQGGIGLGLAIVRHIVELHGGRIEARSAGAGQGATFVVWLPQLIDQTTAAATSGAAGATNAAAGATSAGAGGNAAATPQKAASASASPNRARREPIDLHGVRALVVDDDADTRELLGVILRQAGARPSLAASVADALDLRHGAPPFDVVICDLAERGDEGSSLLSAIRAVATRRERHPDHDHDLDRGTPAIAFTAQAGDGDEARARQAGFDACLTKPIDPYDLTRALGAVLRRDRSRAS
jgi:signal transduction histidine kinase/CheY-like chemotaxis protein